jgi:hypothetical protein
MSRVVAHDESHLAPSTSEKECRFQDTRAIYHYECTHRDGRVTHGAVPWCEFDATPPDPLLARVRLAALGDLDPGRSTDAPIQLGEVSCSVIATKATTQATLADEAVAAGDLQLTAVRRGFARSCAPSFTAPRGLAVTNSYTCTYHGTMTDPTTGEVGVGLQRQVRGRLVSCENGLDVSNDLLADVKLAAYLRVDGASNGVNVDQFACTVMSISM